MAALDPGLDLGCNKKHQAVVHGHAQYATPHHENIFTCRCL